MECVVGDERAFVGGRETVANMPTEEVFTTPDFRRVDGTVSATRPLALLGGVVVEGLRLRFEGGTAEDLRRLEAVEQEAMPRARASPMYSLM